jgi:hypothetical protein
MPAGKSAGKNMSARSVASLSGTTEATVSVRGRCDWRGPMLHSGEFIFAVVIVGIPSARLRLFAPLRRRFAC